MSKEFFVVIADRSDLRHIILLSSNDKWTDKAEEAVRFYSLEQAEALVADLTEATARLKNLSFFDKLKSLFGPSISYYISDPVLDDADLREKISGANFLRLMNTW